MKSAVRAIVIAGLVALLSGCFLVEMKMAVSSDDEVSGTMTLAIEESAAGALGELDPDGGTLIDVSDLPAGATSAPYEQDGYVGQTVTFTDVPLEEFNASMQQDGGTFSLVREGDEFVFTGTIELTGDSDPSDAELEGLDEAMNQALASGSMTMSMTFPGEITDTNGEVDGTTVTWELADFLEETELYATAAADGAGEPAVSEEDTSVADDSSAADENDSSAVLPIVLGIVAAIILIGGAAYLITRRRKA